MSEPLNPRGIDEAIDAIPEQETEGALAPRPTRSGSASNSSIGWR